MIVIDVESSGLSPKEHSILSLGALDLEDPTNQFYDECRIWDGARVDDGALAINGFTHEETTSSARKSEGELIAAFVAWATDRPNNRMLAAQNPSFDLEFVQAACSRAGIDCPFGKRTIDVHTLVWTHMSLNGVMPPTDKHRSAISLDTALNYCGIPGEPKPHNALMGAMCHAEVISRIAYTKKTLPEFESYDIPWQTK